MNTKEHQVSYQNYSLLASYKTGNEWTIAESNKLTDLIIEGLSVRDIALILNRTYYSVQTRVGKLGLAKPRKQTPAPKILVCANCYLVHGGPCD